jgi:cytochrome c-type biogenesis protein CcmF
MDIGQVLIYVAFASALLSTVSFFLAHSGKIKNIHTLARFFFHAASVITISSAAYLLYLILTHQFQYTYVWDYSSRDLPLHLLMSTFYAGQEGSFHLWAFLMAVMGIFLLAYLTNRDKESKDKYEADVMSIFTLIQTFLLFILIIKSPYKMVWESFPKDVQIGFVPPDGRGLNPLLQNFWMSIHPPILFTGFSSLAIPFCFAAAALIKNKYDRWLKLALPWTLFSAMILGTGIMLGGFWAYGVLGWGGYWGWDPVENSSFVPWIVIVAGIHAMITEQKTGRFKKTSLLLCILAYIMVLYSTFLTRSGVLGDASVHSFVDPGQEVYLFLIVFLSLFGAGGLGLLLFRLKSLKADHPESANILSRESALFVGTITLCATALVIAIGTSWPIMAKGTVDPDFYNRMNLPLAILIAAINGFSILLKWRHSEEKEFIKSLYVPLALTAVVTIAFVILGIRDILMAVFAAAAMFAFFINVELAYTVFMRNKFKAGPYVAHLGIMLLFLGIIGSSRYSKEQNVSLPLDQPREALGYKMTYKGATPIPGDEQKYHFNVVVEKDGRGFLLQPIMYYSDYSQGVMKNPDIANLVTKDLYLSPQSLEVPEDYSKEDVVTIKKDETVETKGLKVKFVDFDRSKFNRNAMQEGKDNVMGATLEVMDGKRKEIVTAEEKISQGSQDPVPVQMEGNDKFTFFLTKVSVSGEETVDIAVVDNTQPKTNNSPETLVLTASIKPFINLVWLGTIVMVLGFFFSLVNRYRKLKSEALTEEPLSKNGMSKKKETLKSTNGNNGHRSKQKVST